MAKVHIGSADGCKAWITKKKGDERNTAYAALNYAANAKARHFVFSAPTYRRVLLWAIDMKLLHSGLERGWLQAEYFRSAVFSAYAPVG